MSLTRTLWPLGLSSNWFPEFGELSWLVLYDKSESCKLLRNSGSTSGKSKIFGAWFLLKDWEPIWYLWLLPFLPSLMSPVAYAAGFPSLALVALMTYNNRAARRGSEAGSENQVLFFSGSASDFEPEPEPGSSLAVTDPVDPTTGSGKHT